MKTRRKPTFINRLPHAAIATVMSLHLALPAWAVDPAANTLLNGTYSQDGAGGTIEGSSNTGFFLQSGTLNLSNVTLQNFSTTGGSGSGGGAGLGGALFINSGASVTLNNVNFLSNNATGGNGGSGTSGGVLNNLPITSPYITTTVSDPFLGSITTTTPPAGYGSTGANGADAPSSAAYVNGGNGGNAYGASNGGNATNGMGGIGGNGGSGSDGSPVTADTIKAGLEQAYALTQITKETTESAIFTSIAASFTAQATAAAAGANAGGPTTANLVAAFTALAAEFQSKAAENTANIAVETAKELYEAAYLTALTVTALADGAAGNGGAGGAGGMGGKGSDFFGGGAGGAGGSGGDAYAGSPSIAQGGAGGNGGSGGMGGFGGGGGAGGNGGSGGDSASGVDGATGGAGAGGLAGFGGGAGAGGSGDGTLAGGGAGGSGYGGAIFLRSGATLTITGNALFDGNGVRGGNGQEATSSTVAGAAGGAAGSDIFLMKGATLILNPGAGNTITFNGDPYGSSIADNSAASGIETNIRSGQGADVRIQSGLVQFNGTNLYSGQTKIEGGTLQAQDGEGIYYDSNINFAGSPTADGVLMMNGTFSRYVGTQSNRVQWTGSGGFAASGGELTVRLSNGQAMTWGSTPGFVGSGHSLIFGSATATDKVTFLNNINLNGGNRTILVKANDADTEAGVDANVDWAVIKGVISNGSLTVGDANHTGRVVLAGANTYTGATTVVAGTLATLGDERINNASDIIVMTGATFSAGGNETIGAISGNGTFDMQSGSTLTTIVNADSTFSGALTGEGTLTKQGTAKLTLSGTSPTTGTLNIKAGSVDLTGTLDSKVVNVDAGTSLNSTAGGLSSLAAVTNAGTLNVGSVNDTVASLVNTGTINGTSTLTAATYDLNDGSVLNANLGAGTLNTAGAVTINGTSAAESVNVASGSSVTMTAAERLLDSASVSVNGTLTLGGNENVGTIAGSGTIAVGTSTLTSNALADTTFSGAITGTTGGLTKKGTGKLTLSGNSTYTGVTQIDAGTIDLTGSLASNTVNVVSGATLNSTAGGLATGATVTNAGILNLGATNDTITTLNNTGTINGTSTLVATTYNLNNGTVLNANLGAGTLNTAGTVTMNGSSLAAVVNVGLGSTLDLMAPELLLNSSTVTVDGILNLKGGDETINTLLGTGVVNTNSYKLIVANGGNFKGTLNAAQTDLDGGTGPLTLDGGTTTTNSTTINNTLVVSNGGVLNSTTITLANGGVLDLSGGGVINFTNLTSLGSPGGTINIGSNDFIIPVGSIVSGFIKFIGTGNVINYGTFDPGFSPGLIDLTGAGLAPVQAGGLKVDLAGLGGVGGTDFDQLRIASGAILTVGGVLNVGNFGGFTAAQGNTFQVIAGPGGAVPINHVIGTFSGVTFDNDGIGVGAAPVTNAAIVFDVNTGMITTTGLNAANSTFADLGGNQNQSGAAASIFTAANVGPTTMANQIDSSTTAGALALQLIDATGTPSGDLARYVPDYYGSISDYAFMGDQVLFRTIQDRVSAMNYLPSEISTEDLPSQLPDHMSFFFGYMNSSMDTADNASLSRNDYYAGLNLVAKRNFVAGIAGSMSEGSVRASLGSAEVEGFGAMLFARGTVFEDFTFFGTAGYSNQDFDMTRATVNGTVTGSTDAVTWTGVIGVQHKGWNWGEVSFSPRVSVAYSKTDVGGFSESGAVDALALGDWSATRFVGEAGLSALWRTELAGRPFAAEVSASVQQAFENSKDSMRANIITVPAASYPVNFAQSGDTQAVIRANLSYDIARAFSMYAGYEGHYGSQTSHYIKGGLRVNF